MTTDLCIGGFLPHSDWRPLTDDETRLINLCNLLVIKHTELSRLEAEEGWSTSMLDDCISILSEINTIINNHKQPG